MKIDDGTIELLEGPSKDGPPDSRLETDAETWIAMSAGEMSGDEAFLLGRLGSEGILGAGLEFDSFFTAVPAA